MITRRKFIQFSLAGVGIALLPSIPFAAQAEETQQRAHRPIQQRWMHGNARSGCGRYPGVEFAHPAGLA